MQLLIATVTETVVDFCGSLNLPMLLSAGSSIVTGYFWLVKMNRERAGVRLYRVADFRPDRLQCSDVPDKEKATWYGEIFLANQSTLPIAVVRFEVELFWKGRWIAGQFVMEKKDNIPWIVEPLRVLSRSFGCAFNVEQGTTREQLQKIQRLRFTYVSVDGKQRTQEIETCRPALARAA